ncbi:MAG: hypothetical protein IKH28_11270 [Lachnospiraceae bacterium]|nr:hypothetical protein [Lachnospiraceae bacterium]
MKRRYIVLGLSVICAIVVAVLIIGLEYGRNRKLRLPMSVVKMAIRNGNTGQVTIITDREQLEIIVNDINMLELGRIGHERLNSSGWSCMIDLYYSEDEKPAYSLNLKDKRIIVGRNIYGDDESVGKLKERLLRMVN